MKTMKLLRDGYPDGSYDGPTYGYFTSTQAVLPLLMIAKLHEEVEEVRGAMDNPEEYGDVLGLLLDLAKVNGIDINAIYQAEREKRHRIGGYLEGKVCYRE